MQQPDAVATSSPPPSPESLADKLRLEEFKVLRGEIELRASEQRAMERNVILLSASIYAFLLYPKGTLGKDDEPYLLLAWYLPSLFSFLALVRWRDSVRMIEALAKYLMSVEASILPRGGWETFLDNERKLGRLPITSRWYTLFWLVTCVGTLVIACLRKSWDGHEIVMAGGGFVIGTCAVGALLQPWRL